MPTTGKYAAAIAVWVAAAWFALRGDGRDGFWIDHPMLGALVSGALLLFLAGLVVDKWLQARGARRWRFVAKVGCLTLADCANHLVTTLWGLHSGPDPALSQPGGTERYENLTPAWQLKQDIPEKTRVGAFAHPLPTDVRERLTRLVQDEEWVKLVLDYLGAARDDARRRAIEWAGLMMWADRPRALLNHFGAFTEAVTEVHGVLELVARHGASGDRAIAVDRWLVADLKGRILCNALWESAEADYRFVLPEAVSGVSAADAFRHHDAVHTWMPGGALSWRVRVARRARSAWHFARDAFGD